MLGRGDRRGAGARERDPNAPDVLLHQLQGVEQSRARDDRRAVLVVVKDWYGEGVAQRLFDVEAIGGADRSEEHTSELQSQSNLVCRLLLEKKKKTTKQPHTISD